MLCDAGTKIGCLFQKPDKNGIRKTTLTA